MGCCFLSPNLEEDSQYQSHKKDKSMGSSRIHIEQRPSRKKQGFSRIIINDPMTALVHKNRGIDFPEIGNQLFKSRKYKEAIEQFKLAIIFDQKLQPNFYTNLALSQKADKQFMDAYNTIVKMLEVFNPLNLQLVFLSKAKIIQARSLIGKVRQYCVKGVFSQQQTTNHTKLISQSIKTLEQINTGPINQEIQNLDTNIQNQLLKARKVQQYFKKVVLQRAEYEQFFKYIKKRILSSAGSARFQSKLGNIYNSKEELIQQMHCFMQKMHFEQDQTQEQQLFDPISYEQFSSPFIVASGFTYEEKVIKQHFRKNKFEDPITHQKFTEQKTGVANRTLKRYMAQRIKKINRQDILLIEL